MAEHFGARWQDFDILDRIPEGAFTLREDFCVQFWNRRLEEWTGISRDEILYQEIGVYFPHLHAPKYATRLQQVFLGGPPTIFSSQLHQYIIPCQLPDGRQRIQHTTVTSVPVADRPNYYALFIIEDVTELTYRIQDYRAMRDRAWEELKERQRVEEALRESKLFIQKIADTAPNLLYIYDLIQQQNIYANQQVNLLLGYTTTEIEEMGADFFCKLMHPEDFAQFPSYLDKFSEVQDSTIIEWEYRMKRFSGEWCWFHSRALVFTRTVEGKPKQILGAAYDITQRKWVEETMRQQAERERLIAFITHHIRQSLNLGEVLQTAVAEVQQFLQTDRVMILQIQPDRDSDSCGLVRNTVPVKSVAVACTSMQNFALDTSLEADYISYYQLGYVRSIEDLSIATLPGSHKELLKQWEVAACLDVPILQGDKLWGLLMIHHRTRRQWPPWEVDLMNHLASQLAIAIQQAELYQQLQAANQELQRLATSDPLTGVANRRRFDECLEFEWLRLMGEQVPIALILADVDFFKRYNDTYGHQAGDECLKAVASAIVEVVKETSKSVTSFPVVARYGGEEFVILLPHTVALEALQVAEALVSAVSDLQIPHASSPVCEYVTLSAGAASLLPNSSITPEDLIAAADRALYQAKAGGRVRAIAAKPLLP